MRANSNNTFSALNQYRQFLHKIANAKTEEQCDQLQKQVTEELSGLEMRSHLDLLSAAVIIRKFDLKLDHNFLSSSLIPVAKNLFSLNHIFNIEEKQGTKITLDTAIFCFQIQVRLLRCQLHQLRSGTCNDISLFDLVCFFWEIEERLGFFREFFAEEPTIDLICAGRNSSQVMEEVDTAYFKQFDGGINDWQVWEMYEVERQFSLTLEEAYFIANKRKAEELGEHILYLLAWHRHYKDLAIKETVNTHSFKYLLMRHTVDPVIRNFSDEGTILYQIYLKEFGIFRAQLIRLKINGNFQKHSEKYIHLLQNLYLFSYEYEAWKTSFLTRENMPKALIERFEPELEVFSLILKIFIGEHQAYIKAEFPNTLNGQSLRFNAFCDLLALKKVKIKSLIFWDIILTNLHQVMIVEYDLIRMQNSPVREKLAETLQKAFQEKIEKIATLCQSEDIKAFLLWFEENILRLLNTPYNKSFVAEASKKCADIPTYLNQFISVYFYWLENPTSERQSQLYLKYITLIEKVIHEPNFLWMNFTVLACSAIDNQLKLTQTLNREISANVALNALTRKEEIPSISIKKDLIKEKAIVARQQAGIITENFCKASQKERDEFSSNLSKMRKKILNKRNSDEPKKDPNKAEKLEFKRKGKQQKSYAQVKNKKSGEAKAQKKPIEQKISEGAIEKTAINLPEEPVVEFIETQGTGIKEKTCGSLQESEIQLRMTNLLSILNNLKSKPNNQLLKKAKRKAEKLILSLVSNSVPTIMDKAKLDEIEILLDSRQVFPFTIKPDLFFNSLIDCEKDLKNFFENIPVPTFIFGGALRDLAFRKKLPDDLKGTLNPVDFDIMIDMPKKELSLYLFKIFGTENCTIIGGDKIYYIKVRFSADLELDISSLRESRDELMILALYKKAMRLNFGPNRLMFWVQKRIGFDFCRSLESIEKMEFSLVDDFNQNWQTEKPEHVFLAIALIIKYSGFQHEFRLMDRPTFDERLFALKEQFKNYDNLEMPRKQINNAIIKLFLRAQAHAAYLKCRELNCFTFIFPSFIYLINDEKTHAYIEACCKTMDELLSRNKSELKKAPYDLRMAYFLGILFSPYIEPHSSQTFKDCVISHVQACLFFTTRKIQEMVTHIAGKYDRNTGIFAQAEKWFIDEHSKQTVELFRPLG